MNFLDNQSSFVSVFGLKPPIFESNTSRLNSDNIGVKLRTYANKCISDVFLEICRAYYVGIDDSTLESKMVYTICNTFAIFS